MSKEKAFPNEGRVMRMVFFVASLVSSGLLMHSMCAQVITSWRELGHELGEGEVVPSFKEHLRRSPTFKKLLAERNVAAFLEMSAQRESPAMQMAGFYGLIELAPQTGLEVGLALALAPNSANVALELYPALRQIQFTNGSEQALTVAFRTAPVDIAAATALIQLLPHDQLAKWFESEDRAWVIPTYESLVLARLYADSIRDKQPPTQRMKDSLLKFAAIPGQPRVSYLLWAAESESNYKQTMTLALEDESLPFPSLHGLLRTKAAYITRNVNLSELKVSDERRQKMASALEGFSKPKPVNGNTIGTGRSRSPMKR